jgi:putative transposase
MAPEIENKQPEPLRQAEFQELLHEKMRHAVRLTLIEILGEEVSDLIGAQRYERTATRRDQRNGYYTRDLGTSVGTIEELPVPRTRKGFRTRLFERYRRRQAELDEAIGEMFVYGVSTRRVGEVVESLTGVDPSPSTVSRVFHTLEEEFQAWKERPLQAEYHYAFADGTYFTVIYDREGCKTPILAIVGIDMAGKRDLLTFTVGDRENQQA